MEIGVSGCLHAVRRIEPSGQFVSQRLNLDEAALARLVDSLFIKTHSVGVSPFKPGNFRRHQHVLVGERRWIVFGPFAQLFLVRRQKLAPLFLLVGRRAFIAGRHGQCRVAVIVEQLDLAGRCRNERLDFVTCRESSGVVA